MPTLRAQVSWAHLKLDVRLVGSALLDCVSLHLPVQNGKVPASTCATTSCDKEMSRGNEKHEQTRKQSIQTRTHPAKHEQNTNRKYTRT